MSILAFLRARRRLVATAFVLAALFTVSVLDRIGISAGVGNTTAVVGIAKTPTSTPTDAQIETAVREAIAAAGGLPTAIGPGKKIVIHPNLVQCGWPSGSGVVPNVKVIRTVIQMCVEMGALASDITICEGTATWRDGTSYTDRQLTPKAFKDIGLDSNGDMIEDVTGARLVDGDNVGQSYQNYPGYSGPYNSNYVTQITKPNFLLNRVYVIPDGAHACGFLSVAPVSYASPVNGLCRGEMRIDGALVDSYNVAPYTTNWLANRYADRNGHLFDWAATTKLKIPTARSCSPGCRDQSQ